MCMEERIVEGTISLGKLGIYLTAETASGHQVSFKLVKLPELRTLGVSSITEDQKFVLFMDFDNITLPKLHKQLGFLNKEYNYSHFMILTTGKNRFHVISFEKDFLSDVQKVLDNSLVDYGFKVTGCKVDKGWILRLHPKFDEDGNVTKDKPEFVDCICFDKVPSRKLSRAHVELYSKLYPQLRYHIQSSPLFGDEYLDDNTKVEIVKYGTSNHNLFTNFGLDDLVSSKKLRITWHEEVDLNG